jgi:hypothetical protein
MVYPIIIDRSIVIKRHKAESKKQGPMFGHTPLSKDENIPCDCNYLIIGTGHSSSLPIMEEVFDMAIDK